MITRTERYSRSVVQALIQNPLMCWPEVFVIRNEAFHKNTQAIWGIVRDLVTVHLRDDENVTLTPELVIAALEQLNVKADTSWLCLPVSESDFLEAVHNLHPKTLTSGEMQIRLRLKTQCERIAAKSAGAAGSDDWPELMPISGPEPESMVPEDFPECVAGIVRAAMDCLEVPCELPALLALGVLATACQKKYEIHSAGEHYEPLSLFLAPALDPGERKTATKNLIVRPVVKFERKLQASKADELRKNESLRESALERVKCLRGKLAKEDDASKRADLQRDIDTTEREMPPKEYKPQLVVDDITPEHLGTLMQQNGERMAVLSDEGGIFDLIAGRYSNKANLDLFLQSHAGSEVRVDRGSREPVHLHQPTLTICCSVQPFVLQELGANRAFKGRGLVARFLFAMPKSRLGFRKLEAKIMPESTRKQWDQTVQKLLDIQQQFDEFENPTAMRIELSQQALRVWKQEQKQNEVDMRPGGLWKAETGWASKYPGAVLRIAGVLHCAVSVSQGQCATLARVAESTMESAVRIGRKIKGHTLKVFGEMGLSEDLRFASKIAEWIRRTGQTEFTGRECSRHCNSAGSVKQLEGAFGLLTERGWIRPAGVQKASGGGGGRPSHPFEVNPAVAEFDDNTDTTPEWGADDDVLSVLSSEVGEAVAGFAGAGNGEAYAWADDLLG